MRSNDNNLISWRNCFFLFHHQYISYLGWTRVDLETSEFALVIERREQQTRSEVLWIKSLALFCPRVNPITFFDSRLLAGTHTRSPSDRSVRGRFALLVTSQRDGRIVLLRSRETDSKLRVTRRLSRFVHIQLPKRTRR